MPRTREDPSVSWYLPPGVHFRARVASYQVHLNLLGRHIFKQRGPRYVGSWRLLDDALLVRDSAVLWLRHAGRPPLGFRHWGLGFTNSDPVPFLEPAARFGQRCLVALGTEGVPVPATLPGLRALADGRLPKPVRLF